MGESIQRPHFLSSPHSITIMDSESSQIPVQLLRPKRLHWKVAEILVHLCNTLLYVPMETEICAYGERIHYSAVK